MLIKYALLTYHFTSLADGMFLSSAYALYDRLG